jgi:hypothetical protein
VQSTVIVVLKDKRKAQVLTHLGFSLDVAEGKVHYTLIVSHCGGKSNGKAEQQDGYPNAAWCACMQARAGSGKGGNK